MCNRRVRPWLLAQTLSLAASVGALCSVLAGPAMARTPPSNELAPRTTVTHDLGDIDPIADPATRQLGAKPPHRYVTMTIGGDLGFGGSGQRVSAKAGVRHGRRIPYATLTRSIGPFFSADLVFANLESVVTATNALSPIDKAFNFRMHPAGLDHLVSLGLNVISTANNHAIDYGRTGMRHTLRHMSAARKHGLLAAHGIGATREAVFEPARFTKHGVNFAFAAMGIGGVAPRTATPGQVSVRNTRDFAAMTSALSETPAAFRILSVHYGAELQVRPSSQRRRQLADQAMAETGIDLVIGHHAHTPAGIERIGHRYAFYGLGNLLHLGMQSMGKFGQCRDFGLVAKLHIASQDQDPERVAIQAIELFTLVDMNRGPRIRQGADGRRRIEVINYLSSEFSSKARPAGSLRAVSRSGVRFVPRKDGSGLYCGPNAARLTGKIGRLCQGWREPDRPSVKRRKVLASACRYRRKQAPGGIANKSKLRGTIKPVRSRSTRAAFKGAFDSQN